MMTRHELEDAVWNKIKDKRPDLDFTDIERWSDERLQSYLSPDARVIRPRAEPKVYKYKLIYSDYIERDGRLVRIEQWSNGSRTEVREVPVIVERVRWRGRVVSTSIVLHYLKTGELVERVPKPIGLKPYRAVVRIGKTVKHLGYFATKEERDAAIVNAKLFNPMG